MILYRCISCEEPIQVAKARLTCSTCTPPLTLCANCYVVQDFPQEHSDGTPHCMSVHQHSGYLPIPPPPPVRNKSSGSMYTSAAPRRRPVSTVYNAEVPPRKPPRPTIPAVNNDAEAGETESGSGTSQPSMPGLPPDPQPQSIENDTKEEQQQQRQEREQQEQQPQQPQSPQNERSSPPQLPRRSTSQAQQRQYSYQDQQGHPQYQQPEQQQQQRQQSQSKGWTPFFNQDMTPTPCFSTLITQFFHHLDPGRTGFLSPETFSAYLDACGASANENIWKTSLAKSPQHGYDMADRELADHYTSYSVDFALHPRTPPATPTASPFNPLSYLPASQRATFERFMPSDAATLSLSGNQKPMLSLQGWTALWTCSVLLNPSAAWGQINRGMRHYRLPLWTKWGDIPREMLPLAPYQPEVDRVQQMLEGFRINAERELDALQARLLIEKKGRQNALDLLDDRVYYRW